LRQNNEAYYIYFCHVCVGEDARKNELDFQKKQEMKRWVTEKLYHDDYKKMNEKVEELNYVAMLHSIDAIRGKISPSLLRCDWSF
jgi:hypothetical protein